jgi:hypothetical protein
VILLCRWLHISSVGYAARFRSGLVASLRVVNCRTVAFEMQIYVLRNRYLPTYGGRAAQPQPFNAAGIELNISKSSSELKSDDIDQQVTLDETRLSFEDQAVVFMAVLWGILGLLAKFLHSPAIFIQFSIRNL